MSCISDFSHQPFPQTGRLAKNLKLSLKDLRRKIGKTPATVYSYIVDTVKNHEGDFVQKGSAPNFQGDVISLCTCKHYMRTFRTIDKWCDNIWIAGFTGKKEGKGKNALIYLMKVKIAFKSYCDLWFSENLPDAVKKAKLAHKDKFGDIFKPKSKLINKNVFNPHNYRPPIQNHVHANPKNPNNWHKDINYEKGVSGRKAALLIGDTQYSFLWDEPKLFHSCPLHRGQRKYDLNLLLYSILEER
jgi:hypothetical protein